MSVRVWLRLSVAGLALILAIEAGRVLVGSNWHVVVPQRVYRSAQLTPHELSQQVRAHGIRTVVNLRGPCPLFDWYLAECATTADCDICQEDISLSANRLPPPAELHQLLDVLEQTEYPILIHCRRGSDRTGLVSAIVQLLEPGITPAQAWYQYSPRFGHVAIGSTANVDAFFDFYTAWLRDHQQTHCPATFKQWIRQHYCPGPCRAVLSVAEPILVRSAQQPSLLTVEARNDSLQPWHFKAGSGTGVHVRAVIAGTSTQYLQMVKAGLFDATVAPGERIVVQVPVPALAAGRYCVQIDLNQGANTSFAQAGSAPLLRELRVDD
jgi:protein tyrosine phosphatase (PTP) superfamily phosphohydrolase (DUF442 family)